MHADLLIVNGRVFRGFGPGEDPPLGSRAGPPPPGAPTAVAVASGRIAWLGTDGEAREWRGPATERFDARGGLVLAGFDDAHIHLLGGARSLDEIDLTGSKDLDDIASRVRSFAARESGPPWLVGNGWVYAAIPASMPTADQLDAIEATRPVFLRAYDGHTGWVNRAALRTAGIDRDTPDPANGTIVRDATTGEPTGALLEAALDLVERVLPEPGADADIDRLRRAVAGLHAAGITAVQDAWAEPRTLGLCRQLVDADDLPLRIRLALPMAVEPSIEAWRARLDEHEALVGPDRDGGWLSSGIVKAFADGVVESRTAALLAPYEGHASTGHPAWTPAQLDGQVAEAQRRGWQVEVHAIGDAAVRMALDAFERAGSGAPAGTAPARHRVEHVETIDPADIPRFGRLGIVASMQPLHAEPSPNQIDIWAGNIGPERASRGWAWASILRAGGRLAFGSDWPVVSFDPFLALQSAVNRQNAAGLPEGGWVPAERLGLPEALAAYTAGSAWAAHADARRGTIVPGLDADVAVLDRDLLEAGPSAIIGTGVRLTVVGGRIVHRREDAT
jgi:predicted amidohydrolase YtcJ